MQLERALGTKGAKPRYAIKMAVTHEDVRSAQRLRWRVFAEEQGARLSTPVNGYDIDAFDDHCEHLIVSDLETEEVIGTYRLLTADAARRCGGYYSENEFDLERLTGQPRRLLEIGRSCVHPDYRTGATIALLWSGIAGYLVQSRHEALIGCASIPLRGNEQAGATLALTLAASYPSAADLRVVSKRTLPDFGNVATGSLCSVPPLLKGYLRSGAVICGEPYWDPEFNSADLFLYLAVENVESRYARRFLAPSGGEHHEAA